MVWTEFAFALVTAAVGAIGGLGGAILLVPALVLTGIAPRAAAPLGLVSVAAGSLAALHDSGRAALRRDALATGLSPEQRDSADRRLRSWRPWKESPIAK